VVWPIRHFEHGRASGRPPRGYSSPQLKAIVPQVADSFRYEAATRGCRQQLCDWPSNNASVPKIRTPQVSPLRRALSVH